MEAVFNGIPPPTIELPYPDSPDVILDNLLKVLEAAPLSERNRFLMKNLLTHLHQFARETSLTTQEWEQGNDFLTRSGTLCAAGLPIFILLSDILGLSALVDTINNPPVQGATESCILGPFFTEDAPHLENGDSIASEGKGQYMYVEGRVLSIDGTPIPNTVIDTWETDANGYYDTQYANRDKPDCRGRLHSDKDGRYGFRAVVPMAYPIPVQNTVGELLSSLGRHNMRPNHLHITFQAPGHKKLITAFYPDGDAYLHSDPVFGAKESLVVTLKEVKDEAETRRRGFPKGDTFKLLQRDVILVPEKQAEETFKENAKAAAKNAAAK